jgi:preprotein translocase subunit YajC
MGAYDMRFHALRGESLIPLAMSTVDFLPILMILMIFYFIVMRPAGRERKAREAQLAGIKKHDRVVTNAGIHGTVVAIEDDAVILRVDDKANVRMKFNRQAIWQVLAPGGERTEAKAPEEVAS